MSSKDKRTFSAALYKIHYKQRNTFWRRFEIEIRMALFCRSCSIFVVVLLVTTSVTSAEEPVRYDNYHLLRVVPRNELQLRQLARLQLNYKIDVWVEPRGIGHPVDLFVGPEKVPLIANLTSGMGLDLEILMDNAQSFINDIKKDDSNDKDATDFDWKKYQTLESINKWMEEQAKKYKAIAKFISVGRTVQKRRLTGLRIAHKPNQPIVFIEAGIHAREWISPATATWIIQQVLDSKSDLIQSYEWHIFPSVNPDGYVYSHKKDRMWRKNRRGIGPKCWGVDLNRNYPFKWEASPDPCSETFPGETSASEWETWSLRYYIHALKHRPLVYISLHSYSQYLMYPWGYTKELPANNTRFSEIAGKAVANLTSRHGTAYKYGPIGTLSSYLVPGGTLDYVYHLGTAYPFAFELRDNGKTGYLLPEDQIIPTAEETFDAITTILEEVKK